VTLSIDNEPLGARTCWCRDCQKFGGGNGTTNAFFLAAEVRHSGPVTWYESTADSGNRMRRGFCSVCGSHVFTGGSGAPALVGVRAGALDDSDLIAPQAVIWTDSAPSWAALDAHLPQYPKAAPPLSTSTAGRAKS
jgi:hypothetical protein